MKNKCGPILGVEQETIVGNVNSASSRDYNYGAIMRITIYHLFISLFKD